MNAQPYLNRVSFATAGFILGSLSALPAGEVGPMYAPPAPVADCDACNAPGFYLNAAALYLKSVTQQSDYDGDWDLGGRFGIGFERPDGLFYEIEGFYYEGDADSKFNPTTTFDIEHYAIDLLIGDNLFCGEACLDIAFGLRYGSYERNRTIDTQSTGNPGLLASPPPGDPPNFESYTEMDFDGWGPTIELTGTRAISGPWSLYGELQQSILFGEIGRSQFGIAMLETPPPTLGRFGEVETDAIAFITEIAAGIQFDLASVMGGVSGAHVRLGGEGQYWSIDGSDVGLFGAALSVGFTF